MREQLAMGIDHVNERHFLPLPLGRFPPVLARRMTVSTVDSAVVDDQGRAIPWEELWSRLGINRSPDNTGPMVFSAGFIERASR
eukprot:3844605-Lingulodinium_polyedra.AAC.1